MAQNKVYLFFVTVLLLGCSSSQSYYLMQANTTLNKQRSDFGKESTINNLLSHFPKKIKNDSVSFFSYPPSCPPTHKCSAQFGDVVYIVSKSDYKKELSELLSGIIAYETAYTDSNVIINLSALKRDIFPVKKCNKWHEGRLPIPYFESYDFGLGGEKERKEVEDGESPYYNYTYTIPSDLQVYVIQARAGNFWKENCNENRPESLREWKHGYSKGFAVSEKRNDIVFWTMIW